MDYVNNDSINFLQKCIEEDLTLLEKSNLINAKPQKYSEFKERFNALNYKIMELLKKNETTGLKIDTEDIYSLKWEEARISVDYEFYMNFLNGNKEVLVYQINSVVSILNDLLNNINKSNYKSIEEELNSLITLYSSNSNNVLNSMVVKRTINKIKYIIYKYKMNSYIYSKSINTNDFLSFALDDINFILKDDNASITIKKELRKYILDSKLILKDFNKIIILINLAYNDIYIDEFSLTNLLNVKLYAEEDIVPEDFENLYETIALNKSNLYYPINFNDKVRATAYYLSLKAENRKIDFIKNIIDANFSYVKYLYQAILLNINNTNNSILALMETNDLFKKFGQNYDYEMECAIIAQKDKLDYMSLCQYAFQYSNPVLLDFIKHSTDLNLLVDFYRVSADEDTKEKINSMIFDINDINTLSILPPVFMQSILNAISNKNNEEIARFLFNYSSRHNDYVVNNIIFEMSKNPDFNAFFNYMYKAINNLNNTNNNYIINMISKLAIIDTNSQYIDFKNLNAFQIYYLCDTLNKKPSYNIEDFLEMIKKYKHIKINWLNLLEIFNHSPYINDIIKLFCISDTKNFKKYFTNNKNIEISLIDVINEYPYLIKDYMFLLNCDRINKLSKEAIDIYVSYYQNLLKEENTTINEKIHSLCSNDYYSYYGAKDLVELLYFISLTGYFNEDLLFYVDKFDTIYLLFKLFLSTIKNAKDKYLRPYYFYIVKKKIEHFSFEYDDLFLSQHEISLLTEEENGNNKLKTYYDSLLNLMDCLIPNNIKIRICSQIINSNIPEYITFLKNNYPNFMSTFETSKPKSL